MRGRYEVEDLLKLRASPLVAKPPDLPPKEEWMGPVDPRARVPAGRARSDDAFNQTEGFQKRPPLSDSARKSTTDPERIHLGPPRHSFASSNPRTRNANHERTRTNDDPDQRPGDRRSSTFGGLNGKLDERTTAELDPKRTQRDSDNDASESRPRRDFDRPRWGQRDRRFGDEQNESSSRDGRDGFSRSKFDQPWTRKDKSADLDAEGGLASPPWRRGQRDRDFERHEAEPEWADAEDTAESAKAHTHEDFKAWMEKMKNKKPQEEEPSQPEMIQKEPPTAPVERPAPRVVSDSSASVDKFFAKFEEKKSTEGAQNTTKPTKSRFASLFGAKDDTKPGEANPAAAIPSPPPAAEPEQPAAVDPEKKANEAAFAKLLEMLNKNQAASNPSPASVPPTRSPFNVSDLASSARSPELAPAASIQAQSTRTPVASHTPNLSLDRIIESRSPAHSAQNEQASQPRMGPQDLLNLLRQSNISDKQPSTQERPPPAAAYPPSQEQRMPQPPPGLSRILTHDNERQGPPLINTRRGNPRSIFDDPAFAGYRGEQDYQQRSTQSPDHGGLSSLFASINQKNYLGNAPQERQPPSQGMPGMPNMPNMPNMPPGLQRPPGLDNGTRPPPGWLANPQQRPPVVNYPNANQPPLYTTAYPTMPQQQQQRHMPDRKPTLPQGYPNGPPGFGSSPTYASSASPDGAMYAMRGGYGIDERERMERERQQNAFAAMYSNANRGGAGGVHLPPGFR